MNRTLATLPTTTRTLHRTTFMSFRVNGVGNQVGHFMRNGIGQHVVQLQRGVGALGARNAVFVVNMLVEQNDFDVLGAVCK